MPKDEPENDFRDLDVVTQTNKGVTFSLPLSYRKQINKLRKDLNLDKPAHVIRAVLDAYGSPPPTPRTSGSGLNLPAGLRSSQFFPRNPPELQQVVREILQHKAPITWVDDWVLTSLREGSVIVECLRERIIARIPTRIIMHHPGIPTYLELGAPDHYRTRMIDARINKLKRSLSLICHGLIEEIEKESPNLSRPLFEVFGSSDEIPYVAFLSEARCWMASKLGGTFILGDRIYEYVPTEFEYDTFKQIVRDVSSRSAQYGHPTDFVAKYRDEINTIFVPPAGTDGPPPRVDNVNRGQSAKRAKRWPFFRGGD